MSEVTTKSEPRPPRRSIHASCTGARYIAGSRFLLRRPSRTRHLSTPRWRARRRVCRSRSASSFGRVRRSPLSTLAAVLVARTVTKSRAKSKSNAHGHSRHTLSAKSSIKRVDTRANRSPATSIRCRSCNGAEVQGPNHFKTVGTFDFFGDGDRRHAPSEDLSAALGGLVRHHVEERDHGRAKRFVVGQGAGRGRFL